MPPLGSPRARWTLDQLFVKTPAKARRQLGSAIIHMQLVSTPATKSGIFILASTIRSELHQTAAKTEHFGLSY